MFNLVYPSLEVPSLPKPTAQTALSKGDKIREWLPVVTPAGIVTARASREFCHSGQGPLHPVVHLHIIDRFSNLTLQKRSAAKETYPLLWDTAVGGHISYGEGVMDALFRESAEEIGLTKYNPVSLGTYIREGEDHELVCVYAAVGDFLLSPDEIEVSEVRKWTFSEIDDAIGCGILTPTFEDEFSRIRTQLLSLL